MCCADFEIISNRQTNNWTGSPSHSIGNSAGTEVNRIY